MPLFVFYVSALHASFNGLGIFLFLTPFSFFGNLREFTACLPWSVFLLT